MLLVLWVSKIGLFVQDMNLIIIFNNLVNVFIIGFKCDCVEFQDLLYQIWCQLGGQLIQDSELFLGL